MDPNWPPGQHRRSLPQQYQQNWDYSPIKSVNNGRTASFSHVQYQTYPSPQSYYSGSEQQDVSSQFQYNQSRTWPGGFNFSQPRARQQSQPTNDIDTDEIYAHVRPVDDESWTVPKIGATHDARQQQSIQPWTSNFHGPRAHTVTGGAFSPVLPRAQLYTPTRTSVPSILDSGFVSSNTSSQDVPKYTHSNYEFTSGEPALFSAPPPPPPGSIKSENHVVEETKRRRKPKESIPPCRYCRKQSSNHSDARKHQLQHEKPYRCIEIPCNRGRGFATKNDLERHRKSVHSAKPCVGKQYGHICHACSTANPNATKKWWPRLDNFKAHIERKHKEWDKDQLAKLSEAPRPENAITESGYGGSQPPASVLSDSQAYQQEDLMSPLGMSMSRHGSTQGDMALFSPGTAGFEALAHVGEGPLATSDTLDGTRGPGSRHYGHSTESSADGLLALHDAAFPQNSPVDSIFTSPAVYHGRVPSIQIDPPSIAGSVSTFNDTRWDRSSAKRLKSEWPVKVAKAASSLKAELNEGGEWRCQYAGCNKTRKRECDLRKHHKRHTRPYGCTFPNCSKRFGSRNDWKRHENSQHFLAEMWRCGLTTANNELCGRLMSQESTFVNHLHKRHGLQPLSSETQAYTKSMHLGREGHKNFWCGFCNHLIPQPDGGQQDSMQNSAWNVRCKHIGDHFDKNERHIDDWVCIEHNKKKGLITKENSKKLKSRYREGGKTEDESEFLPDDGIPTTMKFEQTPAAAPTPYFYNNSKHDVKILPDDDVRAAVVSNKRKFEEDHHEENDDDNDDEDDADGVSDCD